MRSLAAFLTDVAVAVGYLTVAAIIGPPAPKTRPESTPIHDGLVRDLVVSAADTRANLYGGSDFDEWAREAAWGEGR